MGVILTGSGETLKPETDMPLHTTDIQDVDRFETATILAARPLLQAAPALPSEIVEIATDYGDFEQLDDAAKGSPKRTSPEGPRLGRRTDYRGPARLARDETSGVRKPQRRGRGSGSGRRPLQPAEA